MGTETHGKRLAPSGDGEGKGGKFAAQGSIGDVISIAGNRGIGVVWKVLRIETIQCP